MQSRVADRHWSDLGKRFLMISFTIRRWAFLCAVLVCVAGPQLSLAQSRTPNNVSPADKRLDSVDNLNRFANGFIQAIKTGDERLFSQVFDFDGLVDREISRIKSNPEVQRGFRDGINGPKGFIRELTKRSFGRYWYRRGNQANQVSSKGWSQESFVPNPFEQWGSELSRRRFGGRQERKRLW